MFSCCELLFLSLGFDVCSNFHSYIVVAQLVILLCIGFCYFVTLLI
jgi:hypothetical protein